MSSFSLSAFENACLGHAQALGSPESTKLYIADLEQWLEWCRKHNDHDPTQPSLHAAAAFRDELKSKFEPATVRRKLAALSAMYAAAIDSEQPLASWNPFKSKVQRPPADPHGTTESLEQELFAKVMSKVPTNHKGLRDQAIMELLYATGLRISPTLGVKRTQIVYRQMKRGKKTVRQMVIGGIYVKNKGRVEVEVPDQAAHAIERWLAVAPSSPWLFPAKDPRRPLPRRTFAPRLEKYGQAAGIDHLHPHRMRVAFATDNFSKGERVNDVQAAMHHVDPKTTMRYDRAARGSGVTTRLAQYRERQG